MGLDIMGLMSKPHIRGDEPPGDYVVILDDDRKPHIRGDEPL